MHMMFGSSLKGCSSPKYDYTLCLWKNALISPRIERICIFETVLAV